MLTTTYSLIAIAIEQKNTRKMLSTLEKKIKSCNPNEAHSVDLNYVKIILNKFMQFDRYCRSRKIETYLIPAIRKTTEKCDFLLAELDTLSVQAMNAIKSIHELMQKTIDREGLQVDALISSMEHYCQHLLKRLIKEEEQLIPVVRCLLTCDEWFSIAVGFMSEDVKKQGSQSIPYV